jgi:uncharacterized membrane protein
MTLVSNASMRKPDEELFRDSAQSSGLNFMNSALGESRSGQRLRKSRPLWPWIVFVLVAAAAGAMFYVRHSML